jgi:hypothetical protein
LSFVKLVVLSFLQGQLHVAGLIQSRICLLTVRPKLTPHIGILRETSITLLGIFGSQLHIQLYRDTSPCVPRVVGFHPVPLNVLLDFRLCFSTACSVTSGSTGLRQPSTLLSMFSRCCARLSVFLTSFFPSSSICFNRHSTLGFQLRSSSSLFCFCSTIDLLSV